MAEYLSPGVYMEEVDKGPKPIEGVGTAMPVFIGFTERADEDGVPELVTNWEQYLNKFGDFMEGVYLPHAVNGFFLNGGSRCYVLSVKQLGRAQAMLVPLGQEEKPGVRVLAKQGVLNNRIHVKVEEAKADDDVEADPDNPGSTPPKRKPRRGSAGSANSSAILKVTSVQDLPDGRQKKDCESFGIELFEEEVEEADGAKTKYTRLAYRNNYVPRLIHALIPEEHSTKSVAELIPSPLEKDLVRAPRLVPPKANKLTGLPAVEALDDVTMVVAPDVMIRTQDETQPDKLQPIEAYRKSVRSLHTDLVDHCSKMKDRVAILDTPLGLSPKEAKEWRKSFTNFDSSYATLYYPWIKVTDPITRQEITIPPSGHVAGVWAGTDNTRGVHKAPANEVVRGAIGLERVLTKGEHDVLNPEGVNCIRTFPGQGIRVYGARTLSSNPSWRYIPIRRLYNFVEKSIERGTQWVVFEPNDHRLWARVRRDVSAFLTGVWREGMLFGLTPQEAFYVTCDESINTPESRREGKLFIEIGMAPVYPAEFVIFRVSQWAGPGAEE